MAYTIVTYYSWMRMLMPPYTIHASTPCISTMPVLVHFQIFFHNRNLSRLTAVPYTVSVDRLQPAYVLADFAVQPTRCAPPLPACDVSRAACNNRRFTPTSRKCGKSSSMNTQSSTLSSASASQNATDDSSFATSPPSFDRVHTHTRTRAIRRPAFFRP